MSLVNKRELAEIFGVSQQAIAKWHDEGVPISAKGIRGKNNRKENRYDTAEVYNWLLERYKKSNLSELDIEDTRLKRAKANKAELEYRRMTGELLPVDIILQVIQSAVITARNKIMAAKYEIKLRLPEMPLEALEIIDKTTREAMDDLANTGTPRNLIQAVDGYYEDLGSPIDDEGE